MIDKDSNDICDTEAHTQESSQRPGSAAITGLVQVDKITRRNFNSLTMEKINVYCPMKIYESQVERDKYKHTK